MFDKFCFMFKLNDKRSWSSARYQCMKQGGDLASVLNVQEKNFLVYEFHDLSWKPSLWLGKISSYDGGREGD